MAIFNSYLRLKVFVDHYEREYVRSNDVIHGEETTFPLVIGIGEEVKVHLERECYFTIERTKNGLKLTERVTIPVIESETEIIGVQRVTDEKLDVYHRDNCTYYAVVYNPNPPKL